MLEGVLQTGGRSAAWAAWTERGERLMQCPGHIFEGVAPVFGFCRLANLQKVARCTLRQPPSVRAADTRCRSGELLLHSPPLRHAASGRLNFGVLPAHVCTAYEIAPCGVWCSASPRAVPS